MGHDCPLIVRIYGTTIERKEFPLPWDNFVTTKLSQYVRGTELTKYALHHMIRDPRECRFAEKIRNYDARIRNQTEEKQPMSSEDKTKYKKLIFDAKCAVIKRKEVILCTCHTSGSRLIKSNTNIKQVFFVFLSGELQLFHN